MIIILNLLLPVILSFIAYIGFRKSKKYESNYDKCKVGGITVGIMVLVFIVYSTIQPSYMPKGTAPVMSKVPIEHSDAVIQDRLLKPMSEEDRQKRVDEIITVRDEVKQVLEQNKKVD
jgi:amino acid transporter